MKNFGSRVNVRRACSAALLLLLLAGSASLLLGGGAGGFAVYNYYASGNFLSRFAPYGFAPGLIEPGQVAIRNGNILVPDLTNNVVVVYDRFGNRLSQFGAGHLGGPFGITITSTGQILVANNGFGTIARFDATGNFLNQFQVPGSFFSCPAGIAQRANGNILVADNCNGRVVEFDSLGTFRTVFGMGWLQCPVGLAVRPGTGDVFVTDICESQQIQVFDAFGNHRLNFGSFGSGPGQLNEPYAVSFMSNGNVLVADTFNARMEVFDAFGNFLHFVFGNQPGPGQLSRPVGIAIQTDGTAVITDNPNLFLGGGNCER